LTQYPSSPAPKWPAVFAPAASLFSVGVGISVLCGWIFRISLLKSWLPGQVTMRVNSAVCFVLLGSALWLLRKQRGQAAVSRRQALVARALAGVVIAIGLLSLSEHLLGWDLRIDQWLYTVRAGEDVGAVRLGLMSAISALDFSLVGGAIILLDWKLRRWGWPAQFLCLAALSSATVGLLDFALQSTVSHTHISFPSTVAFFVLSWGVLCARASWALGGLLISQSSGARWMRRAAPGALLVLAAFGWMLSGSLLSSRQFTWFEVSAIAVGAGILLISLIAWSAILLDRERKRVEESLQLSSENLDELLSRLEDSPVELGIRRWSAVGIATGVLLACLGGVLSWRSIRQAADEAGGVVHTYGVKNALETTLTHAVEIEMGARGFAATGDRHFLESFWRGRSAIFSDLDALSVLIQDNPHQRERIERLRVQIAGKLAAATESIATREKTGTVPPNATFTEGKRWMEAVRATLDEMQAEEGQLLDERLRRADATRTRMRTATLVSTLFGVALLCLAGIVTGREISHSSRIRAQVQALNADLERRVNLRTEELQRSENRLRLALDAANSATWEWDLRTNENVWSDEIWTLYGLDPGSCRPSCDAWQAIVHPDDRERTANAVTVAAQNATELNCEFRIQRRDGAIQWLLSRGGPLRDAAGQPTRFIGIVMDITERKLVEEAWRESELRVRALLDSTAEAIVGEDTEGRCTFCNEAALRLLGYDDAAALLGRNLHAIMHQPRTDDCCREVKDCTLQAAIRACKAFHADDFVFWRKDGTPFPAECWSHPVANGRGIGSVVTFLDISERRQAEQQLALQTEELARQAAELLHSREAMAAQARTLKSVLDNINDGVIAASKQAKLLWNPAAERILGVQHMLGLGEAVGHSLDSGTPDLAGAQETIRRSGLFLPDKTTPLPAEQLPLMCAIRGQQANAEIFKRGDDPDRGTWLEAASSPLRDDSGEVCGGVVAFRDVTQRVLADQQIRTLNSDLERRVVERTEQLEAANKEMEAFTYSVSHDLRAPLRHISGFSKILVEEFGPSLALEAQHYLRRIEDATHQMGQLVDELLTLARVGRRDVVLQVAGLKSIVEEVIAQLGPDFIGREVEWKIGNLPYVECDTTLMKQVFQNLVANSLKFTRPRPTAEIEIGQQDKNGEPVIFVKDNGVGFSMKYADKLFGVFQRLHRQEDFEGTGVGLATVQRIVQKHGGRIWAEAELDKGATFYFTLGNSPAGELSGKAASVGGKT